MFRGLPVVIMIVVTVAGCLDVVDPGEDAETASPQAPTPEPDAEQEPPGPDDDQPDPPPGPLSDRKLLDAALSLIHAEAPNATLAAARGWGFINQIDAGEYNKTRWRFAFHDPGGTMYIVDYDGERLQRPIAQHYGTILGVQGSLEHEPVIGLDEVQALHQDMPSYPSTGQRSDRGFYWLEWIEGKPTWIFTYNDNVGGMFHSRIDAYNGTLLEEPPTLDFHEAYTEARARAQSWTPDAVLTYVATREDGYGAIDGHTRAYWYGQVTLIQPDYHERDGRAFAWTMEFHSPSQGKGNTFVVRADGTHWQGETQDHNYSKHPIDPSRVVSSYQAVQAAHPDGPGRPYELDRYKGDVYWRFTSGLGQHVQTNTYVHAATGERTWP